MTESVQHNFDVVIVGGGLVGASLAVALAPAGLSLAVVEETAVDSQAQPSFDERTVALTYNARQIYTGMGVWDEIAAQQAQPIREIHISERGRFGMTHLHHDDIGTEALGYVVPSRVIGEVLHQRITQSDAVSLFCPATVVELQPHDDDGDDDDDDAPRILTLSQHKKNRKIGAKLVVIADGGRSQLAAQVGVKTHRRDYPQSAIISLVQTDRAHHGRAFERFTAEGPLALLPHSEQRYALVWTTESKQVATRMAYSDDEFIHALQRTFGDRAGTFARPTPRKCYPLQRSWTERPIAARTVVIGNAAHTVHPVAGQGFNLGLRDVAVLAELIQRAQQADLGSAALLEQYAALRRREAWMVGRFTDGLIRLFGGNASLRTPTRFAMGLARSVALAGVELLPPVKRILLRRTMGLS